MSTETLDLNKTLDLRKQKVLTLKKELGLEGQKAQVALALDFSGSMNELYRSGKVQELVERLLPIAMAFDDNGEIDFYLFHNGCMKVPENLTIANIPGYINNKVIGKYNMGGTSYAPVISKIVEDMVPFTDKKTGGIFNKKTERVYTLPQPYPTYVIFITDGANDDRTEAENAIREVSKAPVFFQFVGIGSASFPFLEKLDTLSGRFIDNANFFSINDLSSKSDDDLYKLLLQEFPSYIKEARDKKLIQ